jgi:hypothetical protein
MPSAIFEPATPATKRLQTYALDRSATKVGLSLIFKNLKNTTWKNYNPVLI